MNIAKSKRIESIDVLRGLVMVIMALDHVRDYFHFNAFMTDPTGIDTATPQLFFTRFITHYCAPVFIFLAGTSAYLYGQKRTKIQLSKFLITRGIWLVFVEIFIMNFLWWFDISYSFINLQVIWAIGLCMIVLGIASYLPKRVLLVLGLIIVFGHNMLDGVIMKGQSWDAIVWYILHQPNGLAFNSDVFVWFTYPILPWIGVIFLGYSFGELYTSEMTAERRKKWLLYLGLGTVALFFLIRSVNIYGNMEPWAVQDSVEKTVYSFFRLTKYPPSLTFLLATLGPAFLFLHFIERYKNRVTNFLLVYGRVPFFYYVVHVFVIHIVAMLGMMITGQDWARMIITKQDLFAGLLSGYGYSLWVVYIVWIGIVLSLYPICKRYMKYKSQNKNRWWLSYL